MKIIEQAKLITNEKKNCLLQFKVSNSDYIAITEAAKLYAQGKITPLIRHAVLSYVKSLPKIV